MTESTKKKPSTASMKSIKVPLDVHRKVKRLCAETGETIEAYASRILQAAADGALVAPQADHAAHRAGDDPYMAKTAKVLRTGNKRQIEAVKAILDAFETWR